MGGGSKSTSGSAQKWAKPYAQAAAGDVQSVYNQAQPQLQQITQGVTSLLPGISQNYQSWSPLTSQAQGQISDTIGGKYLDPSTNPYLRSMIDQTNRGVTDQVNSQFSLAGRYGSGAHTGVLTKELANADNNLLYNNYNTERGYQQQATTLPAQMENQNLAQLLQASGVGAELPYTGTNSLANSLAALFSGGTQKQSNGIGGIIQGLGSAASSAAMFSDRRLKSNIEKVDEFEDGLGVYEYDIFGERQRGVMAQEVEQLRPWALGPIIGGYMTVNYDAL